MSMSMSNRSRLYVPALGSLYDALADIAWLVLRLAAGLIVMPHGAQKLFGMFGGGGLSGTAAFFDKIGYSPGSVFAPLVGSVEFFGGLLVAIGLFTRPAAFALFIHFLFVTQFHWARGFFAPGIEFPLLWCTVFLFFAIRGGGPLSVDSRMGREF
jgi:putative oxidoreductase